MTTGGPQRDKSDRLERAGISLDALFPACACLMATDEQPENVGVFYYY